MALFNSLGISGDFESKPYGKTLHFNGEEKKEKKTKGRKIPSLFGFY